MKRTRYAMIILLLVAMVGMASAGLTITKNPATQTVPYGGTATFNIIVTNTGPEDINQLTVFDGAAPDCNRAFGAWIFPAGIAVNYACSLSPITTNIQNVAQAAGYTMTTPPVAVQSNVAMAIVIVGPPPTYTYSLDIEKLPVTQEVYYGDTATFRIIVRNTGTGELRNIRTFDSAAPDCEKSLALGPGASVYFTCDMPNVVRNIQNVVTVQGTKPDGSTVQDSASAIVYMVPCTSAIGVSINPEQQTVEYGGTASWQVIVANLGTCRLRDVKVSEANTAVVVPQGCGKIIGTMPGGTSQTYDCSVSGVTYPFAKTLLASGLDPYGAKMEDTDTGTVEVIPCNPAISIAGTPAAQFVHSGGSASWSVTVTNTGDKALSGVAVSGTVCKKSIGTLAPGASSTYKCSKGGYIRGTKNNMYTYVLTAKGTACTMTPSVKTTLWVTVKP